MLDGNLRTAVDRALIPIGRVLQRIGITADVVTVIGIAMSGGAAVAIGRGNLLLGFILLILTGIPDALDGAVAKAAGTSSKRGAFFDSVSDRLTDALLFGGLTWHYASTRPGHLMMLPVAVMASAQIISYQRAKAELLGYEAKGGVMERAERFIVLALGLLLSVIIGDDALLVVLWIMLALTLVTAIQRFIKVWIQATAEQKNEI
ncbi:MAG: CDP-alcohol phosphatidyltransferase family protein [Actinomycetota bacterium]|jgi:CDP-diacylglycerol--glycerol-3-phosphate 3-phosphatidyltransferase|nr:phosphatidylglycerophosphate synthase [Acidimicrobiaceae bacterium]MBO30263.1 phosphatidylglycerophosphate synthase [Acidimicrobiaceae bacterium]MEE2646275.1 CDP-alcohol phosphatidyltransferase family protein [Actinomycetota bacterium]|tara:strand:+ start:14116 stop:14730 length:615 start_codon:yes stop_codon:yes gene_type:complete